MNGLHAGAAEGRGLDGVTPPLSGERRSGW